MSIARTVVLDNEASQALLDARHRKHRRVLAVLEATAGRNSRRAGTTHLVVPTAVRVEAGWDRRVTTAAVINRSRIGDYPLDRDTADRAADVRTALGVSVADAHLAATITLTTGPHAILTSDTADLGRIGTHIGTDLTIVRI